MSFWIRYVVLVLVCIVGPLGFAFYEDTQSALRRSQVGAEASAEAAPETLRAQLALVGHEQVGTALQVAQLVQQQDLLNPRVSDRVTKLGTIQEIVDSDYWLIDAQGQVVVRGGAEIPEDQRFSIRGHPLFKNTQLGVALDGLWEENGKLYFVGAAPIVQRGVANGAVWVKQEIGPDFLKRLVGQTGADLTVLVRNEPRSSTLPESAVSSIVPDAKEAVSPVLGGHLEHPLEANFFLPLFVDHQGNGIAYASVSMPAPGPLPVRWLISVPAAEGLRELANRQAAILGVLAAALLLALFLGYQMQRLYVSPISVVVDHLSEFNIGKGSRDLPEVKVSGPFQRLVKLVNMTVQKVPASPRDRSGSVVAAAPAPPSSFSLPSLPPPPDTSAGPAVNLSAATGMVPSAAGWASPSPPPDDFPSPTEGLDDELSAALGAAAQSVRAAPGADAGLDDFDFPGSSAKRDASEIRGGTPGANAAEENPMSSSEQEDLLAYLNELKTDRKGGDASAAASGPPPPPPPSQVGPPAASSAPPSAFAGGVQLGGSAAQSQPPPPMDQFADGLFGTAGIADADDSGGFKGQKTVVSAPDDDLLAQSATGGLTGAYNLEEDEMVNPMQPDRTVVGSVPSALLEEGGGFDEITSGDEDPAQAAETEHFKETYERFIEMRRACGEPTADLSFFRFLEKLKKNRDTLVEKYNCKTVRFQVYRKEGKAALKATPIR